MQVKDYVGNRLLDFDILLCCNEPGVGLRFDNLSFSWNMCCSGCHASVYGGENLSVKWNELIRDKQRHVEVLDLPVELMSM